MRLKHLEEWKTKHKIVFLLLLLMFIIIGFHSLDFIILLHKENILQYILIIVGFYIQTEFVKSKYKRLLFDREVHKKVCKVNRNSNPNITFNGNSY